MIKRLLSATAGSSAFARFVSLLEQTGREEPNRLRILTYHRVAHPDEQPALYPRIAVAPEMFEQQMRYLAANYNVVSMPELLEVYKGSLILPPRSIMITFDDAYSDFAEHAWPIMNSYRLPVTLFVPTAFPDQPDHVFWWDWLHHAVSSTSRRDAVSTPVGQISLATASQRQQAFSRLRAYIKALPHYEATSWLEQFCGELQVPRPQAGVLTWAALRQLAREGVTLGAHTRNHPLLNRVSPEEAQAEAVGSLQDLRREIGEVPPIFAYPSGGFTDEVVHRLAEAGFALAFTTAPGINILPAADRLRLRRFSMNRRATLAVLRTRLHPWAAYLNRWQPLTSA